MDTFRPVPLALVGRIHAQADSLAAAKTTADQIRALFLAHCELKDAEEMIGREQPAETINQNSP